MLICVLLSLFVGRLVQLQGLDASTYVAVAGHDRLRPTALPAQRGVILDRDGEPLARSSDAYHLTTDQKLVTNPAAYALQLDGLLAADVRSIQRALTGTKRFQYVAKELTPQTWRAIDELDLQGIYAEPASHREYPAGAVAGNVIGFVGADGQGVGWCGAVHGLAAVRRGRGNSLPVQRRRALHPARQWDQACRCLG